MGNTQIFVDFLVGKKNVISHMDKIDSKAKQLGTKVGKGMFSKKEIVPALKQLEAEAGKYGKNIMKSFNAGIKKGKPIKLTPEKMLRKDLMGAAGGMDNMSLAMNKIKEAGKLGALGSNVDNLKKNLFALGKQAGLTQKGMKAMWAEGSRGAARFDMRMLSVMFSGMAIKRLFGGMLRGITQTFMKAEDETSGLSKATTRLTASWEFFKFSLMDALNTPFFIMIIDGVIKVIDWFGQLPKVAKVALVTVVAGLALVGTLLMVIGQTALGWKSIMGTGGVATEAAKIAGPTALGAIVGTLAVIAVAALIVVAAFKKFPEETKPLKESLKNNLKPAFDDLKNSMDSLFDTISPGMTSMKAIGIAGVTIFSVFGMVALAFAGSLNVVILVVQGLIIWLVDFISIAIDTATAWDTVQGVFSGRTTLKQAKSDVIGLVDSWADMGDNITDSSFKVFDALADMGDRMVLFGTDAGTALNAVKNFKSETSDLAPNDLATASSYYSGGGGLFNKELPMSQFTPGTDLSSSIVNSKDLTNELTDAYTQFSNITSVNNDNLSDNTSQLEANNDAKQKHLDLLNEINSYSEDGKVDVQNLINISPTTNTIG